MLTQACLNPNRRLRMAREALGLAQYALAVMAGTSPTTVLAIERYGHRPRYAVQERIARALNLDVADFWPEGGGLA
jgi:transcriptional regulator with XRE-family HTH domain